MSLRIVWPLLMLILWMSFHATGQPSTVEFKRYDNGPRLDMDIYPPSPSADKIEDAYSPLVICIFGGGFLAGSRTDAVYLPYYKFLTEQGFTVAAIDYRLGLKDAKKPPSLFNRKPIITAIEIAVQDVYAATDYLLKHATDLKLDTGKFILSGSSAGAITALQADYEKRNNMKNAKVLPAAFQYAAVVSFAGAIYSREGRPDYDIAPAPTLFFHGSKDNWVPYNKVSLLGTGVYGSKCLAKRRKKQGYSYCFYSFENVRHDVAAFPMKEYQPQIQDFFRDFVFSKRPLFIDINIKDLNRKNSFMRNPSDIYK
ncbi:alpha/beta hydrolase [Chryseolinea sp. T2]|uniref:alpha/beta hydrolase n=1 Tax=Chryseolinea sp. T2 TaxID=3129255 RepID=UPI003077CD90